MKKREECGKFGIPKDRFLPVDPEEIARARKIVREQVVEPLQKRAAARYAAWMDARWRFLR